MPVDWADHERRIPAGTPTSRGPASSDDRYPGGRGTRHRPTARRLSHGARMGAGAGEAIDVNPRTDGRLSGGAFLDETAFAGDLRDYVRGLRTSRRVFPSAVGDGLPTASRRYPAPSLPRGWCWRRQPDVSRVTGSPRHRLASERAPGARGAGSRASPPSRTPPRASFRRAGAAADVNGTARAKLSQPGGGNRCATRAPPAPCASTAWASWRRRGAARRRNHSPLPPRSCPRRLVLLAARPPRPGFMGPSMACSPHLVALIWALVVDLRHLRRTQREPRADSPV